MCIVIHKFPAAMTLYGACEPSSCTVHSADLRLRVGYEVSAVAQNVYFHRV